MAKIETALLLTTVGLLTVEVGGAALDGALGAGLIIAIAAI